MIFSRSAEYAIRAFVYLAELEPGKYGMVKRIAEETGIPGHFLAKLLQQSVRQGFLRSSKGPTGGFCLRKSPTQITLLQIVESIDGLENYRRCIGGTAECSDNARCGLHDGWKEVRSRIIEYLEGTSVADVARSLEMKRRLTERHRPARKDRPAASKRA